ncbi:MAG: carboxypeptidase regulatory-like domain-containing protein [Chloroflexi bacterium]|nr:carboxypeptidase regulatory-like domain-containing protein [Chloroflexota bacterium]
MTNPRWLLILLFALVLVPPHAVQSAPPISVTGTVFYSTTPMPNVEVQIRDSASGNALASVKTAPDGAFSFSGVGVGEYSIVAKAPSAEFQDATRTARVQSASSDTQLKLYLTKPIKLLEPASGAIVSSQLPTFRWEVGLAEAVRWGASIALADGGFYAGEYTDGGSWTPPYPLCPGSYTWRAFAVDGAGNVVGTSATADGKGAALTYVGTAGSGADALRLSSPDCRTTLPVMTASLAWQNPPGTTQYQLQVIPFKNDGPGINLIRGAESSYVIPAPAFGQGNYLLLPDMTYQWRVRTSTSASGLSESDAGWATWSDWWTFRTPRLPANTVALAAPASGETVGSLTPTLTWTDPTTTNFYYQVEVSTDPSFTTNPAAAIASVYQNLVHGALSTPQNSYTVPASAPLEANATYYWRVRPRVQGDGGPLAWSKLGTFCTGSAQCRSTQLPGSGPVMDLKFSPAFATDGIAFVTRDSRYFGPAGNVGISYITRDGGNSWTPVTVEGFGGIEKVRFSPNFAQDGTILAGGVELARKDPCCGLVRSEDSGASWKIVHTFPLPVRDLAFSPSFVLDRIVFALWNGTANAERSRDGGTTWTSIGEGNQGLSNTLGGPGFFSWVVFSPNYGQDATVFIGYGSVFSVSENRYIDDRVIVSRDRGVSWGRANSPATRTITRYVVSPNYVHDRTLFAATNSGVLKSSDGGESWVRVLPECTGDVTISPRFASNGVVLCGGGFNSTYRSRDAGQTWGKAPPPFDIFATFVFTPDGSQMWAVTRDDTLLRLPAP